MKNFVLIWGGQDQKNPKIFEIKNLKNHNKRKKDNFLNQIWNKIFKIYFSFSREGLGFDLFKNTILVPNFEFLFFWKLILFKLSKKSSKNFIIQHHNLSYSWTKKCQKSTFLSLDLLMIYRVILKNIQKCFKFPRVYPIDFFNFHHNSNKKVSFEGRKKKSKNLKKWIQIDENWIKF